MNHLLYEHWILEPEGLNEAQQSELRAHLDGCQACRKLRAGWQDARLELGRPETLAPRAGFTRRWMAGTAERRIREQRAQAWRLFLACGGAAAALLAVFVVYLLSSTTPVEWIQASIRAVSTSVGLVGAFRDIAVTWLQNTPPVLNVAVWISLAVSFCVLTFIWVFALWKTSVGGVMQK